MTEESAGCDVRRRRLPEILAAVLSVFWAVAPARAAQVSMQDRSNSIEISGGIGASAWRLTYGTHTHIRVPHELAVVGDIAYFSHGFWLRQIDTRQGVVTGRWRFPWQIAHIVPEGDKVRVDIAQSEDIAHPFRHTVLLDPKVPQIPNWPGADPAFSITEATSPWRLALTAPSYAIKFSISPERARQVLPEVVEMARRDPLSPWFQITQAALLRTLGDPGASGVFREAITTPSSDYTELIRISAFLSQMGEKDGARESFERGYRDFLERGFDPRLMRSIWTRRGLYPVYQADAEWMERAYRLAPYSGDSSWAWQGFARRLEAEGHADQAKVWRERAADPQSFDLATRSLTIMGFAGLGIVAADIAFWIYMAILFWRYRKQRLQDRAAGTGWTGKPYVSLLRLEYADRRERAALLGLMLTASTALGLLVTQGQGLMQTIRSAPSLWTGSLAGPVNISFLENQLPASQERDLLRAVAYDQSGEDQKAERLYRALPGFAESWNNLGVLLKKRGKDGEARAAFEQALRLDPSLAEAELNLRGTARDFWTKQHAGFLPGKAMVAVPRGDRFERVFYGRSLWQNCLRSLAGPFLVTSAVSVAEIPLRELRTGFFVMLSLGVALLLVAPRLRVTIRDTKVSRFGEILLPGASRVWLWLGGLPNGVLMVVWCGLLVYTSWAIANPRAVFDPFMGGMFFGSNLTASYGIDVQATRSGPVLPVTTCVLLFAVNLALLVRSWRREG